MAAHRPPSIVRLAYAPTMWLLSFISIGLAQPPQQGAELPWAKGNDHGSLDVIRQPSGVREIFERYDLGERELTGFINGQPLMTAEEELIARILYRLPRIDLANLEKWRRPDLDLNQLLTDSEANRLEVIPLQGQLRAVSRRQLSPELASRLEMKHFYLAEVHLTGKDLIANVALQFVPQIWNEGAEDLDEPVTFDGVFLKHGGGKPEPRLIFAAPRLRWHPDREIPEQRIGRDQLRLAKLGFDVSLLETLRDTNNQEISGFDREPMYQLLDLVGRTSTNELGSQPRKLLEIVPLLKDPERHQGELLSVQGFARRITKVVVDDPDIRSRFGIDHYYLIDLFVNLEETSLKFARDPKQGADEATPTFTNEYPVTLCVRELPADLKPKDNLREQVRAEAIFMKTWAYGSTYMSQFENQAQISPLLIAKTVRRHSPQQPYNWVSDAVVAFALIAALFVMASVVRWYRQGDQPTRKQLEPDFSALEQRMDKKK